ncbi:hypothetical protein [Phycisphaera mikurensis]|uniref:PEP-CTERM protein-sorting domain-containing protein n=1 Tax=Phycisphaera mikurensis (strain NBRC 102666 / KCTC 22515 / FYK2301M01) TaxID=1142394 RepID=I0II29_PHYMF|nr:hypothetical protein [Phycisphaera mikurensis]MBB6442519.1 hypothetical protein [Phycisphaera mikurensis]BAM04917.1 hypothetical protein PSMK_27580 [Phycisphaera mikurensis NBRC 102666]
MKHVTPARLSASVKATLLAGLLALPAAQPLASAAVLLTGSAGASTNGTSNRGSVAAPGILYGSEVRGFDSGTDFPESFGSGYAVHDPGAAAWQLRTATLASRTAANAVATATGFSRDRLRFGNTVPILVTFDAHAEVFASTTLGPPLGPDEPFNRALASTSWQVNFARGLSPLTPESGSGFFRATARQNAREPQQIELDFGPTTFRLGVDAEVTITTDLRSSASVGSEPNARLASAAVDGRAGYWIAGLTDVLGNALSPADLAFSADSGKSLENFSSPSVVAVPEPAGSLVLAAAAIGCTQRRRPRERSARDRPSASA